MLHRFLHSGPYLPGAPLVLEGEEGHHAARAVRVRAREKIELFDGRGAAALASVVDLDKSSVRIVVDEVIALSRELPFRLTLAAAVIHPDKYELVLQKGTELGVTRFVPLLTDRVETRIERIAGKRERWERIILEATKQSGRTVIAALSEPMSFKTFAPSGQPLFFDADVEQQPLPASAEELTVLIGPEGGWSEEETALARSSEWTTRRLGARRLRAETASLAAIVSITAAFGALD